MVLEVGDMDCIDVCCIGACTEKPAVLQARSLASVRSEYRWRLLGAVYQLLCLNCLCTVFIHQETSKLAARL
ncbi:hypothetical protein GUJ93_ZPchr0004g39720 [Zizania palustris]|uniref:Uncharacterized protein n=1 Tax=Zizania palustris TaxID=103762 RepID=A0A8J5SCN6_ZIZPA|nr:hypothetical protein GUJ93_ZPchr0004g39720 [Zizania palustris]